MGSKKEQEQYDTLYIAFMLQLEPHVYNARSSCAARRTSYARRQGTRKRNKRRNASPHVSMKKTVGWDFCTHQKQRIKGFYSVLVSPYYARKSASQTVLINSRMQLTLHANRETPHGASRFVQAMSA